MKKEKNLKNQKPRIRPIRRFVNYKKNVAIMRGDKDEVHAYAEMVANKVCDNFKFRSVCMTWDDEEWIEEDFFYYTAKSGIEYVIDVITDYSEGCQTSPVIYYIVNFRDRTFPMNSRVLKLEGFNIPIFVSAQL